MFVMEYIGEYFNDKIVAYKEYRAYKTALNTLSEMIPAAAAEEIAAKAADVKTSKRFTDDDYGRLLGVALGTDDAAKFKPILEMKENPNVLFGYSHLACDGGTPFYRRSHILYRAIAGRHDDLALMIAEHPKIDVRAQSFYTPSHVSYELESNTNLGMAYSKGMKQVEAAIEKRMQEPAPVFGTAPKCK